MSKLGSLSLINVLKGLWNKTGTLSNLLDASSWCALKLADRGSFRSTLASLAPLLESMPKL